VAGTNVVRPVEVGGPAGVGIDGLLKLVTIRTGLGVLLDS